MNKKLKIAIVGAGSSYTPELIEGLSEHRETLPVKEIVLLDINEERLSIMEGFVKRYVGYTTADIFPPTHNAFVVVWNVLENYLVQDGSFNGQIDCIHQYYIEGWSK